MSRALLIAAACAALAGCAGINKSMTYSDVKHVVFTSPELSFWIFDRPEQGKMLINQAPGSAMADGAVKGLTLGMADPSRPHQVFERGANLWLKSTGRNCTVTDVEEVWAPTNFEATYSCR